MKVTVLIPNYNGKGLLETNLPRILKLISQEDVVVVDDASVDGSVEFLKAKFPKICLIEKFINNGFATTVNLGMKTAKNEIVLLLNSDAIPNADTFIFALKHFSDPTVAIVACLDESFEKGNVVQRGRGIGAFTKGFLLHKKGDINKTNTLWASGGSSFFRKSIWEKLHGMNELYDPFYWEDIDYSYRVLKSGYKIVFEKNSKVEHYHEKGSISRQFQRSYVKTIAYRNQFIFIWSVITDPILLFKHCVWLPLHLFRALITNDQIFIKGFFMAIQKLPAILTFRSNEKELFILSDQQILAPYKKEYHL